MDQSNLVVKEFEKLKANGLQAKNPDQSFGMKELFKKAVEVCRFKGFSESDIGILFETAKGEAGKPDLVS